MIYLPISGFISLFSCLLYLIAVVYQSAKLKGNSTSFVYVFLAFIILHFSYGLGSLSALFRVDYLFRKE
jgi:hypothetical protein